MRERHYEGYQQLKGLVERVYRGRDDPEEGWLSIDVSVWLEGLMSHKAIENMREVVFDNAWKLIYAAGGKSWMVDHIAIMFWGNNCRIEARASVLVPDNVDFEKHSIKREVR